jgi:hypothetical protein
MATISSPGHPDCSIDCPGSGYAVFVPLYGPCMAGCDQDRFSAAMIELFQNQDNIVSGKVIGVKGEVLARMALALRALAPDEAFDNLAWLERLAIQRGDVRFSAQWQEQSLSEVIETLAEATGREIPRGRLLRSSG